MKQKKNEWADVDFSPVWYMLYQNATRGNSPHHATITRHYCAIDEREMARLHSIADGKGGEE